MPEHRERVVVVGQGYVGLPVAMRAVAFFVALWSLGDHNATKKATAMATGRPTYPCPTTTTRSRCSGIREVRQALYRC